MRLSRPRRRGYTLLELIAAIVVLGVLAALSIASYRAVTDRTRTEVAETEWEAVAREAQALAVFDPGSAVTRTHVEQALADRSGAGALIAAAAGSGAWTYDDGDRQLAALEWIVDDEGDVTALLALPDDLDGRAVVVGFGPQGTAPVAQARDYDGTAASTDAHLADPPTADGDAVAGDAAAPPGAPTGVATTASGDTITVTWASAAGAASYDVLRDGVAVATGITSTSHTDTGLAAGTYAYTVRATNAAGASPVSDPPVTATVSGAGAGAQGDAVAPTNVTAVASGADVTVSWDAVAGADSYSVFRDSAPVATGVTATAFTDPGLADGTYSYTVRSVAGATTSPASLPPVSVTVDTALPAAPTGLTAEATGADLDVVALTWDDGADTDSYELRRNGTRIADLVGVATSYTDRGVARAPHTYELVGVNHNGAGPAATVTVDVTGTLVLAPPATMTDGATTGVAWHLGTDGGTTAYTNPAASGLVEATMSSQFGDRVGSRAFDHDATPVYGDAHTTNTTTTEWWQVDLGVHRRLAVSDYAVRSRANSTQHPRAWELQGSNDGVRWTTLDTHGNDGTPGDDQWTPVLGATSPDAYRFVRIQQTGPNSNGQDYLVLGEVELWGTLEVVDVAPSASLVAPVTVTDADTSGLFWHLGTAGGTAGFTNPTESGAATTSQSSIFDGRGGWRASDRTYLSTSGEAHTAEDGTSAYWQVDLGPHHEMAVETYAIRARVDKGQYPRSWKLMGSNDGSTWTTLDTHAADGTPAADSWTAPLITDHVEGFRHLRIQMTGNNSTGRGYLVIGELEFWGDYTAAGAGGPMAVGN